MFGSSMKLSELLKAVCTFTIVSIIIVVIAASLFSPFIVLGAYLFGEISFEVLVIYLLCIILGMLIAS